MHFAINVLHLLSIKGQYIQNFTLHSLLLTLASCSPEHPVQLLTVVWGTVKFSRNKIL